MELDYLTTSKSRWPNKHDVFENEWYAHMIFDTRDHVTNINEGDIFEFGGIRFELITIDDIWWKGDETKSEERVTLILKPISIIKD